VTERAWKGGGGAASAKHASHPRAPPPSLRLSLTVEQGLGRGVALDPELDRGRGRRHGGDPGPGRGAADGRGGRARRAESDARDRAEGGRAHGRSGWLACSATPLPAPAPARAPPGRRPRSARQQPRRSAGGTPRAPRGPARRLAPLLPTMATAPPPDAPGPSAEPAAPLQAGPVVHASGIVPTLQNVVATVNLDTRLDLKAIALHARNAEYNPKVREGGVGGAMARRGRAGAPTPPSSPPPALRRRDHAHPRPQDDRPHLRVGQDGEREGGGRWNGGGGAPSRRADPAPPPGLHRRQVRGGGPPRGAQGEGDGERGTRWEGRPPRAVPLAHAALVAPSRLPLSTPKSCRSSASPPPLKISKCKTSSRRPTSGSRCGSRVSRTRTASSARTSRSSFPA